MIKKYKKSMAWLLMTSLFITGTGFSSVRENKECVYHTFALSEDPYVKYQWAFDNQRPYHYYDLTPSGQDGREIHSIAGVDIQLEEALDYFKKNAVNREIIVAMIDTGIDRKQEDLQGHFWSNELEQENGEDDDGNGLIDDLYGWNFYNNSRTLCNYDSYDETYEEYEDDHGTHCAGTIVATPDNGVGIMGIAGSTNVKILPIKALGGLEGEESGTGVTSSIVRAIRYAEQMGASICNLSFGGDEVDPVLEKAIQESDMLFVCAAGNDGRNLDIRSIYPASYGFPNVISVANLNSDGTISASSNYSSNQVDLAAPGSHIMSTGVNDEYKMMTGTSMAAPMVTGVAALLYSFHENMTPADAKEIILSAVDRYDSLESKVRTGGCLNAWKTLRVPYEAEKKDNIPKITLSKHSIKGDYRKKLGISIESKREISEVRIKKGKTPIEVFKRGEGTILKRVKKQNFIIKKPGIYTLYVKDRAGFETIETIELSFKEPKKIETIDLSKITLLDELY